jgi:guanylate kinase
MDTTSTELDSLTPRTRAPASRLLVTVGPSASGKSSVVRILSELGLLVVHPTWTTRPRRDDEAGGALEHHFVSERAFDDAERRGDFLGSTTMFGLPYRYGLPTFDLRQHGPVDTVMLRAPLVPTLEAVFPGPIVYCFDAPDRVTSARLAARCTAPAELSSRSADNRAERGSALRIARRTFDSGGSAGQVAEVALAVRAALVADFGVGA